MTASGRRSTPLIQEKVRLYVGINDTVLALNPETGEEIWRTKLGRMAGFVTVALMNGRVYAATSGEVYCLDAATGEIIWHDELKGLGRGFVNFAGEGMVAQSIPQAAGALSQYDGV